MVLVDDSIVRGTTSRKIVRMVRQAGAREVHLRISCPPTISPCFYGVDTPTSSELIASNHTVEEIRRFVEADTLGYLSLGSLRKAVGDDENHEYCYACYTGDYPTELVNIEELISRPPEAPAETCEASHSTAISLTIADTCSIARARTAEGRTGRRGVRIE